jgi:diguanylate cyclase (GGDEF)-like protein
MSRIDLLTGFHNLRSFYEQLSIETTRFVRTKRVFSLAYIDLDNFKNVNDTFGHEKGNTLLREFASTVRSSIRKLDIPGRIGGDEFVILFSETDEKQVLTALKNIVKDLNSNLPYEQWGVSYSIGIITFYKVPDTLDEIIKLGDHLMYKAKKDGKNRTYSEVFGSL